MTTVITARKLVPKELQRVILFWVPLRKTKTQTKVKLAGTGVQHFDGSVLIRVVLNPPPYKVVHTGHSYIIKGGITQLILSYYHLGKAKIRGGLIGCTVAMVPYYVEKITMACLPMFAVINYVFPAYS